MQISDDLTKLNIYFGGEITVLQEFDPTIPSYEICVKIFNQAEISKLGVPSPQCQINLQDRKHLMVEFGSGA